MTDHLVILRKKWLNRILDGVKPVEFRAGHDRRAPWGRVAAGDRLWLKESGGPVRGVAYAGVSLCTDGHRAIWAAQAACGVRWATSIDLAWAERLATARYATLVPLERVERLAKPLDASDIRGRRQDAWQVLDGEDAGLLWDRYFDVLTTRDEAVA